MTGTATIDAPRSATRVDRFTRKCGRVLSHSAAFKIRFAILELQLEVLLAEVEFHGFTFLAAFPHGLEPLVAGAAVGRLVPDQRHGLAGLDSLSDIEEAVFFAVLRYEDFRDQLFRGVFHLEGVFAIRAARHREHKSGNEQSAADKERFFEMGMKLHK